MFFILRIVLALILLTHGLPKIKNREVAIKIFSDMGFKNAKFWSLFAGFIEVICGGLILFGFLTQIASLIVVFEFIFILIFIKKIKPPFKTLEFELLILASALVLSTVGGGVKSLDYIFPFLIY